MNQYVLKIDGMACGMCESHINDVVRRSVPQAKKIASSHKKGETTFIAETEVDLEKLQKAIAETGYTCVSADCRPYEKKGLFRR